MRSGRGTMCVRIIAWNRNTRVIKERKKKGKNKNKTMSKTTLGNAYTQHTGITEGGGVANVDVQVYKTVVNRSPVSRFSNDHASRE